METRPTNEQPRAPESHESVAVMRAPEVAVRTEPGAQMLSLLLKAYDPSWGSRSELAKKAAAHFALHPLDPRIRATLDQLKILGADKDSLDQESLYIMALAVHNPEKKAHALAQLREHKSHIGDPEGVMECIQTALIDFEHSVADTPIARELAEANTADAREREADLPETKQLIQDTIDFYRPDPATTNVRRVTFAPVDPLYRADSASGFEFGDEQIIHTGAWRAGSVVHEFSHRIINPIVDRLDELLTESEMERIGQIAPESLRVNYGNYYYSLLCEELIRTYTDVFRTGATIRTRESIASPLREIIYVLYQEYAARPDTSENFEHFFLTHFREKLS